MPPPLKTGTTTEMRLDSADSQVERAHIEALDTALHREWALGRNIVLTWVPCKSGIDILVIPHYVLSEYIPTPDHDTDSSEPESVIQGVISGPKKGDQAQLKYLSKLLGCKTLRIDLPFTPGVEISNRMVESIVKRYGISYSKYRAVTLFDIVGFTLLSPLYQVTQLNSLAYSINSAHSKMMNNKVYVNFARTTTGDGFYIWNRDRSIEANVNLYHFMHLILADNAVARKKSGTNTTPLLRAGFHVGGHYEFYQSEGLSPTIYSYIVGDVTIELARMVDNALPGQILVGDFLVPVHDSEDSTIFRLTTVDFIDHTQETLSSLNGLELSGEKIDSISCYLTGEKMNNGEFTVHKYMIVDKHFKGRNVYNAKINIYRKDAEPLYLGLQSGELDEFNAVFANFIAPTA